MELLLLKICFVAVCLICCDLPCFNIKSRFPLSTYLLLQREYANTKLAKSLVVYIPLICFSLMSLKHRIESKLVNKVSVQKGINQNYCVVRDTLQKMVSFSSCINLGQLPSCQKLIA